jgi:hypothetical protein
VKAGERFLYLELYREEAFKMQTVLDQKIVDVILEERTTVGEKLQEIVTYYEQEENPYRKYLIHLLVKREKNAEGQQYTVILNEVEKG